MKLRDAISSFFVELETSSEFGATGGSTAVGAPGRTAITTSLHLLSEYCSQTCDSIEKLTPEHVRDFLARGYINAVGSRVYATDPGSSSDLPDPGPLIASVGQFLRWCDLNCETSLISQCKLILGELEESLPRAIQMTAALVHTGTRSPGPFTFPQFLTSFENGGRSLYDIDSPGDPGTLDGYMQIVSIEGERLQARDLITGETVGPILVSNKLGRVLAPGYVMDVELIRTARGWEIASCGFVYPPGTELP